RPRGHPGAARRAPTVGVGVVLAPRAARPVANARVVADRQRRARRDPRGPLPRQRVLAARHAPAVRRGPRPVRRLSPVHPGAAPSDRPPRDRGPGEPPAAPLRPVPLRRAEPRLAGVARPPRRALDAIAASAVRGHGRPAVTGSVRYTHTP